MYERYNIILTCEYMEFWSERIKGEQAMYVLWKSELIVG
jgi:hypothetical protein